jgi:DNA-binding NarL/FixJ family response regulator
MRPRLGARFAPEPCAAILGWTAHRVGSDVMTNDASRAAWAKVRRRFASVLSDRHEGDALEEVGWAGWWLGDEQLTFRARERAYRFYCDRSDRAGAGRVATWLALDRIEFRADSVAAHEWLSRAQEALDGDPESADHAWLMLVHADLVHRLERDLSTALALARRAGNLGRAFGVADIEAIGAGLEGLALAGLGAVAEARPALDAAAAIAEGEPMRLPFSAAWTLELGARAFEGAGDLTLAARWCDAARAACVRSGSRHLLGRVRTTQGRLLMLAGDWSSAERELVAAVRGLKRSRPGMLGLALARLGELHAHQGRDHDARELLQRAGVHGFVGAGLRSLAVADNAGAAEFAQRFLRHLPDAAILDRFPAVEVLARARLRGGDPITAESDVIHAERAAAACGTPFAAGIARLLRAELHACRGEPRAARDGAEAAVGAFGEAHAPYHAAQARVVLAAGLAALGRASLAERERGVARQVFERLGALGELERLHQPPPLPLAGLTVREAQILRMLADGWSDGDIAAQLALSPSTVHRNVVSLRAKLRLPSRAATSAYAVRSGLT